MNQQQDIPELMRAKVLNVTRQFLHTIDPKRFYTTFSFPNEIKYPKQAEIEDELISRVTTTLKKDFCAAVLALFQRFQARLMMK